jgi:hypothetical protein
MRSEDILRRGDRSVVLRSGRCWRGEEMEEGIVDDGVATIRTFARPAHLVTGKGYTRAQRQEMGMYWLTIFLTARLRPRSPA